MAGLAAFILSLVAPGIASADTGSITGVTDQGDGTVIATYTSTADCAGDTSGFCYWFPYAVEVAASDACDPYGGDMIYVGVGVDEGPGTRMDSDYFYPTYASSRLCLYISYGADDVLVAQSIYTPPEPEPEIVPPMRVREAKSYVPGILKKHYKRKFSRHTLKRSCFRYTTEKVRCRVSWRKGKYKYWGRVTMWNDPDDPATSFIYAYMIKRKRTHKPHHAGGGGANCDPNYSGCLRPNVSDYDCAGGSGDGPYYTGRVVVLGNDHYDLDRDGDGVACESSGYSASAASVTLRVEAARSAMLGKRVRVGVGKR